MLQSNNQSREKVLNQSRIIIPTALILIAATLIVIFSASSKKSPPQEGTIISSAEISEDSSVALLQTDSGTLLQKVDSKGMQIRDFPTTEGVVSYRLSPSKDMVVFTTQESRPEPGSASPLCLWLLQIDSGEQELLECTSHYQILPALSKKNDLLAFTTPSGLFVMDLSTKQSQPIFDFPVSGQDSNLAYVPEPFWTDNYSSITLLLRAPDYLSSKMTHTYKIDVATAQAQLISSGLDAQL